MNTNNKEEKIDSEIINISNEFIEDDNDQVGFKFSSSNINLSFLQLYKYSQMVREQIRKEEIINGLQEKLLNYQIKANIKEENIITFFQLLKGQSTKINNDQYLDLFKLAEIFKVNSLINSLKKYTQNHSKDVDFILNIISEQDSTENTAKDTFSLFDQISSEMESCLSHNINECIQNDKFQKLPIPTIYRILDQSSPEKIDHDMLYEFISKSIEERHILYHFINLQKLSNDKFDELYDNYLSQKDSLSKIYFEFLPNNLEYIREFRDRQKLLEDEIEKLKKINENLQKSVTDNHQLQAQLTEFKEKNTQLQSEIEMSNKSRDELKIQFNKLMEEKTKQKQGKEFIYSSNFNGIINSLNKQCGGNCSKKGIISVTCSKVQGSQNPFDLTNYSNLKNKSVWIDNQLNGYFEFDFKEKRIIISQYELQTPNTSEGNAFPKSWSVECTNDKEGHWFVIDDIKNNEILHGSNKHGLFKVHNPINEPCRFVRIYQRGLPHNSSNSYYLGLSGVEFYGQRI